MLSVAHSRYRAKRGAIRSVTIPQPAPPPPSGTMLQTGAPERLFDAAEMRANPGKIAEWNNHVYANSGPYSSSATIVLPNGTRIRHKNAGVKTTIARSPTTGGYIRMTYPKLGQDHKDPTDSSAPFDARRFPETNNPDAPAYIDAAHQNNHFMNPDGSFYSVAYGQEIEMAARISVPIPSDSDDASWDDGLWFIVLQLETNLAPARPAKACESYSIIATTRQLNGPAT